MTLVRKKPKGILGIDPGLDGGLVLLGPDRQVIKMYILPTIESTKKGTKKQKDGSTKETKSVKRLLDLVELNRMFEDLKGDVSHCFMEQVASRPGMSAPAVFKFGRVYGILEGLLTGHQIPYTLVTPQRWSKTIHAGIEGGMEPKDKSRVALGRLFPKVDLRASERSVKPHEGLMDGLLIAEWGRRFLETDHLA